jgi:hypothetical protein
LFASPAQVSSPSSRTWITKTSTSLISMQNRCSEDGYVISASSIAREFFVFPYPPHNVFKSTFGHSDWVSMPRIFKIHGWWYSVLYRCVCNLFSLSCSSSELSLPTLAQRVLHYVVSVLSLQFIDIMIFSLTRMDQCQMCGIPPHFSAAWPS